MNLRKTLFILPNLFTLSSIFCGFYACVLCLDGRSPETLYRAALLVVFAMFFDIVDGRVARLTKTQSAFGVQFDSLADLLSFGAAPALLMYHWSLRQLDMGGVFVAFAFVACGAIRLARFNVLAMSKDGAPKGVTKYIVGLPIPGAAGLLVALVIANHSIGGDLQTHAPTVAAIVALNSFLMVSTVKFRSFKDLRRGWKSAALIAFGLISCVSVGVGFHVSFVLVWIFACYIGIALIESVFLISKKVRVGLKTRGEADSDDKGDEESETVEQRP